MTKIHVSVVKVNREYLEQHFDELVERLYPERKSRVLAFRRREPAYTSIVAGLLLQTLVEEKLGISPQALVLEKNENGKPTVQGHPAFYFNLSHAGDYVVLAHGDVPLGVDIEQFRALQCSLLPLRSLGSCHDSLPAPHLMVVLTDAYVSGQKEVVSQETAGAPGEVAEKLGFEPDDSLCAERFFYLWTMKEAYLKLTGDGISVPLNSFEIDPVQKTVIGTSYRYFMLRMDDYWISVCAEGDCTVEYRLDSCIRF